MRITEKTVNPKTKEGRLTLQAEQDEDMYQLYNLIQKGDQLESLTVRNVRI
jgi:protein pelota